jgi:nucleoside-diphosphate-sugar epimerase
VRDNCVVPFDQWTIQLDGLRRLEFARSIRDVLIRVFAADLSRDDGWAEAVAGCDYVIHPASPMPPKAPKREDELIIPARDGVFRVLTAARDAKVKRVVSSGIRRGGMTILIGIQRKLFEANILR